MDNYKNFGVMLDVSRNAVMNVETLKTFINYLEKMGYDSLELYAEDTYKIEGEPYFGYQRGGYTGEELKEIDEYCKLHGIELIPCIQTLAHYTNLARLPYYKKDIIDTDDILLIDEPKTYELLDKIFATCAKNFTSRKINIGMDEAHFVGLGKYLDKHGYIDRYNLLNKHLSKVCSIAEKYGFKPHMWSDMFFRLAQNGHYYSAVGEKAEINQSVVDAIPDNIDLVYWDYYHFKNEFYEHMISQHKALQKEIWFAGAAWSWLGFAPNNYYSFRTMKPAMKAVIKEGIDKVLITIWGDGGSECSAFAVLPSLYAISEYAKGNFDNEKIEEGFEELFGIPYSDFMTLDLPNYSKFAEEEQMCQNPCKILLYQDCFMSIFDDLNEKYGKIDYASYAKKIYAAGNKALDFKYIFDCLGDLCLVLDKKMMIGVETRKLYKTKDKAGLSQIMNTYDEVVKLIKRFHQSFMRLWFKENKPFGWEVQDIRLGGVMRRVETCRERLKMYIDGEINSIPELEEEILEFSPGEYYEQAVYSRIVTRNSLCHKTL